MSQYTQYPFYTAYTHLHDIFGVDMAEDMFETSAFVAWRNIGNKNYRTYKTKLYPQSNPDGGYFVNIPCNCEIIESVTTNYEDYQKTTPTTLAGNNQNGWIEGYVETRKYNTGKLYVSGKFIKYREENNKIILSDRFQVVNILYKGYVVDDDGLPYLSEKEVDAIAVFCAYTDMFKKALLTRDGASMQLAQILEQK